MAKKKGNYEPGTARARKNEVRNIIQQNPLTKEKKVESEFFNRLVCTKDLPKLEWLKYRQKGIGGSDIAAVCDLNPFHSPLSLYLDKTEEIKEETDQFKPLEEREVRMAVGVWNEPHLRKLFELWFLKNEGIEIIVGEVPYILQHPTNKIALANVDGVFFQPDRGACLLEIKTTGEYNKKDWEDDNVPAYYYTQAQWYMYVMGYLTCYIAFLIGNRKFDVKMIERNGEVIKEMVKKADFFWKTFVIPKVAPAPSGDISSSEALKSMYPKEEEGTTVDFTGDGDLEHNFIKVDFVNEQIKGLMEEREVNKQAIKAKQGVAEVLICGEKKSTWKEQSRKEYVVKASKSRVFRISKYKGGEG